MEFGSWAYSGLYLRPIKMGEGYTIGGSATAGESYAEFSLVSVACEEHLYPPYPTAPEEDWPVLFYHVTFQRAWQPYARGYLVLQIVLNLASFCGLWLPPHIGERMSLAITALLASVASELVVAANLPPASELTWFAKFSMASLGFSAATLFESATVIYFYYQTADDLVPRWYRFLQRHGRTLLLAKEPVTPPPKVKEEDESYVLGDDDDADDKGDPTTAFDPSFATRQGIKTMLGRDADDFKSVREMENNVRWQKVASDIDETARVVFPIAFCIWLGFALSGLDV
jgi:hypothetical protein